MKTLTRTLNSLLTLTIVLATAIWTVAIVHMLITVCAFILSVAHAVGVGVRRIPADASKNQSQVPARLKLRKTPIC